MEYGICMLSGRIWDMGYETCMFNDLIWNMEFVCLVAGYGILVQRLMEYGVCMFSWRI